MNAEQQFWLNWWINAGVAIGTLLAALVALFGDVLRLKWFPPKLQLELARPEGEWTQIRELLGVGGQGPMEQRVDARYYHLRVTNQRRWSTARDVQVFLIGVEHPGPDGTLQVVWSGDVPMVWQHQNVFPVLRTVGPKAYCDLLCARKDGWLTLLPLITPNNLTARWNGPFTAVLSLQARSRHADSSVLKIEVSWDGRWNDGEVEMGRHLVLKPA